MNYFLNFKLAEEDWKDLRTTLIDFQKRCLDRQRQTRPTIVCLCGSTRFYKTFEEQGLKLTLEGKIVLSIGACSPDEIVLANPSTEEGKEQKKMLDELHKRRIDLADEVLILNVGGYIGSSTRSELHYARSLGKKIIFLEEEEEG